MTGHRHIADRPWDGSWSGDDPHGTFKAQVAEYTRNDPVPTLAALSEETGVPVDALARYALVRWCAEGSEALLQLGPRAVENLWAAVSEAEADGSDAAKLAAYERLKGQVSWLRAPLE